VCIERTSGYTAFRKSLVELGGWLLARGVELVVMESTSVFLKPVCEILEEQIPGVYLVNALEYEEGSWAQN
jgi:hypothetical protein